MSGGRLVVLDRLGRDTKAFTLAEGSASIGSDPACDIRVILPGVRPHHATVAVHAARTLVRAVEGETLLNGAAVSVAALQHGDTLRLGGRALRWDYARPPPPAPAHEPCLAVPRRGAAARKRRRSEPARRDLHAPGRDSAPASTSMSGKQVAIVQPQRRDTSERNCEVPPAGPPVTPPVSARKLFPSKSPKPLPPDDPTKASLWIESRKPRSSPQLPAQSPRNSPRNKSKLTTKESPGISRKKTSTGSSTTSNNVSVIVRDSPDSFCKRSPARDVFPRVSSGKSPRVSPRGSPRVSLRGAVKTTPLRLAVLKKAHSAHSRVTKIRGPLKIDQTKQAAIMLMTGHAPRPKSAGPLGRTGTPECGTPSRRPPARTATSLAGPRGASPPRGVNDSVVTQDIRESEKQSQFTGRRSSRQTLQSPALTSPKKSALKDPKAKKSTRKTESIKFDLSNLSTLSNLESDENVSSDVVSADSADFQNMSDEDITLHYSDNSSSKSPSPTKTIHSRSSRIIEKSLGSPMKSSTFESSTSTAHSPRSKRSLRGNLMVQKALHNSDSRHSRKTSKSLSDQSYSTTITSRISETLIQRSPQNLEAYSIVDLVSLDSNESGRSIYNSVDSNVTESFGTPNTIRKTRSKNSLFGSSTPYSKTVSLNTTEPTNQSSSNSRMSTRSLASITTPENIQNTSLNSTRISKSSRNKSRINDSDVLLVNEVENEETSPRSSRRISKNLLSPVAVSPSRSPKGTITPENRHSPQDIGTPMLSIQNLLDQSSLSLASKTSQKSKNTRKSKATRRTIGHIEPKRSRLSVKSRSLNLTGRRSLRARKTSSGSLDENDQSEGTQGTVTPKSAVKLVQEAVKNKHSTAKKPLSKRSLIDNLDDSYFVKELFNSPVKRKLSQSMTEFSRKFCDDDVIVSSRPTRNTVALMGRTPDNSVLNNTQAFTPEIFVSPLRTPSKSPNLSGIKRLFQKNTPDNDLRNVRGVKTLLRTPRARKSINNGLSNISGVKKIFGRSPRNRLSDVRVKEVFALLPTADLSRVSGVKALFQKSPLNDLRNVSGVKTTLKVNAPRNNLSDVRGVKQLFREQYNRNNLSDVSGVEELFDEAPDPDASFDRLLGRPRLRAYAKSNSCGEIHTRKKGKNERGARSLHDSIGLITDNVEEWLESELKKRTQRSVREPEALKSASRLNVTRELRRLHTDTVEGNTPRSSAGRNLSSASQAYSARKLPLKKRSLASPARARDSSLPLKKRPLPHSTPLRPARAPSMNASELSRVSPIAADAPGISLPPPESPKPHESPRPRAPRGRRPKAAVSDADAILLVKPSPKRTRGRVMRSKSPRQVQAGATRVRKAKDNKASVINKNNLLQEIANKPQTAILKPSPKIKRSRKALHFNNIVNSSNEIVSKAQKSQTKITPKKTRSKVLKNTVVVHKPSPQIKLRNKRQIKESGKSIQIEIPNKTKTAPVGQTKAAKTKKTKEPTEVQETKQSKRGRQIAVDIEAMPEKDVPVKRGRKAEKVQSVTETHNKRTRNLPDTTKTKPVELQLNKNSIEKKVINRGKKKVTIVEPSPVKPAKTKTVDKVIRKSRRGTKDIEDKENTNNAKEIENPEKKTRASKKNIAERSEIETKVDGRKSRRTAKAEPDSAKAKKTSARATRKRAALDPVEDTAVETKKRRTRRAV